MDPYARSIIEREHIKQRKRSYIRKANLDRRMRRQELGRECRERELLKREGGHSYKSSYFGSETFSERIIKRPSRTRRPRTRRITTTSNTKMTTARGKGVKRRNDDLAQLSISFHLTLHRTLRIQWVIVPTLYAIYATKDNPQRLYTGRYQDGQR